MGNPNSIREAAIAYHSQGYVPIPCYSGEKFSVKGWQNLRLDSIDIDKLFPNGSVKSIGILNGEPSGGLVDVDHDCPEARAAASILLPETKRIWGRQSAPTSHYAYRVDDPPSTPKIDFNGPSGEHICEIRGTGGFTFVPPGIAKGKPQRGSVDEPCVWHRDGEAAHIEYHELHRAVGKVASASLIAMHWPAGSRHAASLALAGGLLRAGWLVEDVERFVEAVCRAAGDDELRDRLNSVRDSVKKLEQGENVSGWPSLATLIGDAVVAKVREWLAIRSPSVHFNASTPTIDPASSEWPTLHESALYGLPGEIVGTIDPATEADPVAILMQTLIHFGNRIGRNAHFRVEADTHHANEFCVLMGQSSKARKGTSQGQVQALFRNADALTTPLDAAGGWCEKRIVSGLSSGEGLIWQVRDPIEKKKKVSGRGEEPRYEMEVDDPGETDKRLLVIEPEFANVLKQTERQGNTLSPVVRQSWDGTTLRTLTKNSAATATDPHISIIGHITTEELKRYLSTTESSNGFGNRFLWVAVKRSKFLPEGGRPDPTAMGRLSKQLAEAIRFAETADEVKRDAEARTLWCDVYEQLSTGRPGLAGSLLARAEAHVMRLAMLYALLDCSSSIRAEHLLAAIALWDYCERSVLFVFGDAMGDPLADDLARLIRQSGERGISKTDISNYLTRNVPADKVNRALMLLVTHGVAHPVSEPTGGRSAERWFAGRASSNEQ